MPILSWNRSNRYLWRNASLILSLKPVEKCLAILTTQCRSSSEEHSQSLYNEKLVKACIMKVYDAKNGHSKQKCVISLEFKWVEIDLVISGFSHCIAN